jgi:hypothetical protein
MFLGRGAPLRSPHRGRRKAYPYEIQNLFLKDYTDDTCLTFSHLAQRCLSHFV